MKNSTNLILILLAIGLFYTFSLPVRREVAVLQAKANEYESLLGNVSHMIETRNSLLSSYQAIPRLQIERLSKMLPDNVDAVRLALDLDTIAARYGIAIKEVKVNTQPDQNATLAVLPDYQSAYQTATVAFSFVSNYANFIKLMGDVERNLRIMDVKSINFKSEDSGIYEHTVILETYWLK